MRQSPDPTNSSSGDQLPGKSLVPRKVLVGSIIVVIALMFAFAGGWLTPHRLTPSRFTDGLEEASGPHPGFRRNHAKGVDVSGYFESNGKAASLCKSSVFQPGRIPVIGRFSHWGAASRIWLTRRTQFVDLPCGLHFQAARNGARPW